MFLQAQAVTSDQEELKKNIQLGRALAIVNYTKNILVSIYLPKGQIKVPQHLRLSQK